MAGGIFCLALAVRLITLLDTTDYPAFKVPIVDERAYDRIARQWTGGAEMSTQFFWQPFFYPFFLSGMYAANGGSIIAVKAVQATLGAITCALTFVLGQRVFGRTTGLIAGGITAFYGPLIFYETGLLPTGWAAFWAVAVLLLFLEARARQNVPLCLALGSAGALATITRPTFLPFFLAGCIWLAWTLLRAQPSWRRRIASTAAVAAGFLLVTLPVAVQNARVTGQFSFLPWSGGVNIYIGNHPEPCKVATAVGLEWQQLMDMPTAAGVTAPYAQQSYFYQRTWEYVRANPLDAAKRLLWKSLALITPRELPRSLDVYVVREWSAVQTLLTWKVLGFGFPFGALLPLALVGVVYTWRQIPIPMALFLVLYPAAIIVVFVTARYRMPMVPVLATLAAAGVVAAVHLARARRWGALALTGGGCIAVALLTSLPGPFCLEREDIDSETGLYLQLGHYHQTQGDMRGALKWYLEEIRHRPKSVAAHKEIGLMLVQQRPEEALEHFAVMLRRKPHLAIAHNCYGGALYQAGRLEEAAARFREAIAIDPTVARYHMDLGNALLLQHEFAAAADAFRESVRRAPDDPAGHLRLGMALRQSGEPAPAIAAFRRAAELEPDSFRPLHLLGDALEAAGRVDEAIAAYRAALRIAPHHTDIRQRLDRLLQGQPAP